jgi:hypothetical protein
MPTFKFIKGGKEIDEVSIVALKPKSSLIVIASRSISTSAEC